LPLMAGGGEPKISRIRAFVGLMKDKEYAIPENDIEITTQLLGYNMKKKSNRDDLIDSAAYGHAMLSEFMHLIISQFENSSQEVLRAKHGTEVESV